MKKYISFIAMLAAGLMFCSFSCQKEDPDNNGNGNENDNGNGTTETTGITLRADRDVIKCDGTDAATFSVIDSKGNIIKEGVTFFDSNYNEVTLENFKFSTKEEGEYSFWAAYKTDNSGIVTIKAINADIPEAVADPNPSGSSFVRRVFLAQFTGTQCGYCPGMTNWLNILRKDLGMKDKTVLAAVHSEQNSGDPAAISAPRSGAKPFNNSQGVPFLSVDMMMGTGYTNSNTELYFANEIKKAIEERMKDAPATVGISVNPKLEEGLLGGNDGIIARVQVKSSETAEYAVGAWLLEDNLLGLQSAYETYVTLFPDYDYDMHSNCVRVADSKNGDHFAGHDLGQIQKGKTAEKTFLLTLKAKWKLENMHLVVFVCKKGSDGAYSINNVIDCPIDTPTPYEYSK